MFGNTDKPVESIANDTFGIGRYINGLCTFILHCDTPMTISIQGDWGSGKTSMMNMVRSKIEESVHTIWFNTWQFSQFQMQDNLAISMLCSLLSELDYDKKKVKDLLGALGNASKTALKILADNVAGGVVAEKIGELIGTPEIDSAEKIKQIKNDFQNAINEKLNSLNKEKAVIFIDDLDRLQPAKAVELLEILKVFLDCEKCVFVLAVDYSVVTQGIKQKFGDSVDEEKGKSFFDKIIQLPFKMPVAQYDISSYISDALKGMGIVNDEKTVKQYVGLIENSIGCNPRSIKRLFNTYMLLDIMTQESSYNANDSKRRIILFAIICMQMEFDELYNFIVSSRDTLSGDLFCQLAEYTLINNDENLKKEIGIYDDNEIMRISLFMKQFINVIQIDDDMDVSDAEIDNLKNILYFSTITSVSDNNLQENKSDDDWHYRYANKEIVSKLNDKVYSDFKSEFKLWQPRKNNSSRRISDTWSLHRIYEKDVNFEFDFYLKTDYTIKTTFLNFALYPKKPSTAENIFEIFGELKGYTKNEWGYEKNNVFSFLEAEDNDILNEMYIKIKLEIEFINKTLNAE
jgi:uridine kinase